jgi:hypothetical protein
MMHTKGLNRLCALTAYSLVPALLTVAFVGDVSAKESSSILLRLQQPANLPTQSVKRFRGFVAFGVPGGWTIRRREVGDVVLSLMPTAGCSVRASVQSLTTLTTIGPAAQLKAGLPAASEPGQPESVPARTIASGRELRDRGAWDVIEPPMLPGAFTLYAGTVIEISHGHWAGLQVALATSEGCRSAVLRDQRLTASLVRLLKGARLHRGRFG